MRQNALRFSDLRATELADDIKLPNERENGIGLEGAWPCRSRHALPGGNLGAARGKALTTT